jgi:flagellar motility protein MotE (MotC chaperone)
MKKLLDVLMLVLAINFIVLAVGVVYLFQVGRLDKDKVKQIRELVFATSQPSTQPSAEAAATTQPGGGLDQLLAQQTGHTAAEQVEYIQRNFDAQQETLDRRQQELLDLKSQVDLAQGKLSRDRAALEADRKKLQDQQNEAARLAVDKGFQDALALYEAMPAKQAKGVFMGLDDATVVRYLDAMDPLQASKILKEFKSPDEVVRVGKLLERIRQSQASVTP